MRKIKLNRLEKIFSNLGGHKILVVGDVMLDEYLWGNVSRISPEAPVPVVEIAKETIKLGGAANVALNIETLGAEPILVGLVGKDKNGEKLKSLLKSLKISDEGILVDKNRPTTSKTRIIAHHQQIVRADRENIEEMNGETCKRILKFVNDKIKEIDAVVISDYGKGMITLNLLNELIDLARKNRKFIAVDPKETHFMNYKKVSIITPNHNEASFAFGKRIKDEKSLEEVGWGLLERLEAESILITRGEKGMSLFQKDKTLTHFPTVAKKVYDVTGAGDTVISAFSVAYCAGADLKESALISNHAAGIVVGEIGTAQVNKKTLWEDLKDFVNGNED
ncbi:MAG: D-glycero-beta-D-manno-heptose-7-phosphate kinase [candidate division Zixibacteria bacterium]|nr:D-glycero-beta-D-manno-heptose-7-phosphate kinase [candidate division Zixibacteria bacterium]